MYDNELIDRLNFVVNNDFVRLTYTEGVKISRKNRATPLSFPCTGEPTLQSEHERYLVEKHFKCPVILTDYPKEIKIVLHETERGRKTVRAMDVLFPKIGEIIGGSEREENYDKAYAADKRDGHAHRPDLVVPGDPPSSAGTAPPVRPRL